MWLLDTNTVSYYFRGEPRVVKQIQALSPKALAVPAIVEYELLYGLMRLPEIACIPRLAGLTQFLSAIQVIPFDSHCAQHAARIRAELEAQGTPIGPHDTLIAATTMAKGGTLVTRNSKEFARVQGLQWVNWHSS